MFKVGDKIAATQEADRGVIEIFTGTVAKVISAEVYSIQWDHVEPGIHQDVPGKLLYVVDNKLLKESNDV